ncbi:hypothetical protein pgond44_03298 [Psychroflexus gondwanensis ACAM 44]|uniref:DUF6705 domain-containing protein n=1 Tax=Psychroflexus gondwanensis ACAM 44 TaxID=1189619 RepID=N1WT82_9FLAO|nr:DUF6705 family protein [Psychroflexus gondwanensis]EMY82230.1 hypothetical protein pgond44_03298 [Psychroflexus gondwanensis ACAM 44]
MKTLIFILAVALSTSYLTAQEVTLKKGMKNVEIIKGTYYKTDSAFLDKYQGVWTYSGNNIVFKFKIFRKKTSVQEIYIDRLKAQYCIGKECDIEKVNTFILSSAEKDNIETLEKGTLRFRFYDNEYKKFGVLEFKLLQENKASWKLLERGGYKDESFRKGFSVPNEML